ncbi:dienelactone hydrolase family protein [Oxalicibacterium faecigallinarum]|uniref:Carboxymethylenebutenolidase n=1 Tax=Oxalicibacterium faecigallinarum TaxID=573741 RepID=A0A8J3B000_9BURK|nr:dienelactone hydrolase family protein [Oxalicibacterium faecigallinarum]GGI21197.1 carboxymethylenebutenolidase [Oxalicibacterium faecigallinarum]
MENMKEDFDSLVGKSALSDEVNRRGFLKTTLGTGFAAAVLPVCAQSVVKTDADGLTAGTIHVTINGQEVPVYRAQPAGKKNLPVILVISEIFGVHEYIADVTRRFARQGYLALAPDLFVRQGDPTKYPSIAELQKELISKVPDAQVMSDLDAIVAWAKANGGNTARLGITGFCWGGRITWLYAAHNPQVKAGVAWYGRLVGSKTALQPTHPVDIAASLKAPVLGLYGGKDTGIPVTTVVEMQDALKRGKSGSEFILFKDAGHAFHADYRPSYVEADAKEGWQHCLTWFKANGV